MAKFIVETKETLANSILYLEGSEGKVLAKIEKESFADKINLMRRL